MRAAIPPQPFIRNRDEPDLIANLEPSWIWHQRISIARTMKLSSGGAR